MQIELSVASAGLVLKHGKQTEIKLGDSTLVYSFADGEFRSNGDSYVEIKTLRTPMDKRGTGSARALMEHFLRITDKAGLDVILEAEPLDAATKSAKLVKFYKTFGFKVKGRISMIRKALK